MKILSIAIPCYNSSAYMAHCIESLLIGGEDVEILIVDDGSTKDNTAEIADSYAAKYPTIIKAIHQENAGHGGAVNKGLANATGKFFKVVDSDDWVNKKAYLQVLDSLKKYTAEGKNIDAFFTNFVYEKDGAAHKKIMQYHGLLPEGRIFGWNEMGHFGTGKYILMHSVIYRTQMLKDCGLKLPEHTFYVDNIFVFQPFPYVHDMYYLDVELYRYYIGRTDQSVNESVMIGRIDQQIKVNRLMIDYMADLKTDNQKLYSYMLNYLNIISTVTTSLCIRSKSDENIRKYHEVWAYMKEKSPKVYHDIRKTFLGIAMNLPGKAGRKIIYYGYKLAQKLYGFN